MRTVSVPRSASEPVFPRTRYQGSKQKLLPWIWDILSRRRFTTILDAFGGTGCVSHLAKRHGKAVTYNDILRANAIMAVGLIENDGEILTDDEAMGLTRRGRLLEYDSVVADMYRGIYYTDEENVWLDVAAQNIRRVRNRHKRAIAWYALFQACAAKRPYNLFHRKNLSMRLRDVPRSFGNKTTWDTPFETHFLRFVRAANAAVFKGRFRARVRHGDVSRVRGSHDLVYLDPPYTRRTGASVDYGAFYHFLEGLADYPAWRRGIDRSRKHRPLRTPASEWSDARRVADAFERLLDRTSAGTVAVSYREDGIPSIRALRGMLERRMRRVEEHRYGGYTYALSTNRRSEEVLLVGAR